MEIAPDRAYSRSHPAAILHHLSRFLYLLILPTLRGLGYGMFSDFAAWVRDAWMDLALIGLIAGLAVYRWLCRSYCVSADGLCVRTGFLFRRLLFLPRARIASVRSEQPLWLRPFRAASVEITAKGVSARLYLSRRRLGTLCELCGFPRPTSARVFRAESAHLALYALLTSDSFGGVVFAGVLISRLGSLLGRGLREEFVGVLTEFLRLVAVGAPGAALTAALVLLAGWGAAFARSIFRHSRTELSVADGRLLLGAGLLSPARRRLRLGACVLETRQTLLGRALGLTTAYLENPGLGRDDEDRVLLLSARRRGTLKTLARLFPSLRPAPRALKPRPTALFRYIGWPAAALAGLLVLPPVLGALLPFWRPLLRFAGWMGCIPAGWRLLGNALCFRDAGVGYAENPRADDPAARGRVTLRYPVRGTLCTATFAPGSIRAASVRRSPFFGGRACTLAVTTGEERPGVRRVRGLSSGEADAFLDFLTGV